MLEIKNKSLTGEIIAIRTAGGEEIIGKMVMDTPLEVTIAKPILVHLQMVQGGQAAISFAPFTLARDDAADYTFYKAGLLGPAGVARDDIRASYIQATTGITVPTSGQASSLIRP